MFRPVTRADLTLHLSTGRPKTSPLRANPSPNAEPVICSKASGSNSFKTVRYLFAVVEWDWTKTRRRKSAAGRDAHAQGG